MVRYFVPIDATDLYKIIVKNDHPILCSLICRADYKENKDNQFLLTHVLLAMDGIAFQKLGENQFYYWYSRPEHDIIFGKQKITIDGFQILVDDALNKPFRFEKIQDVISPIYSGGDFKTIQNNFSTFCKIISNTFKVLNQETFRYAQDAEYLRSGIIEIGINDFIDVIRTSYNAGFKKEVGLIVEKALKLVPKEEREILLEFSSEIKC
ncbi:MAG: hypothetical protein EU529_05760 [Promethearchaeota archaeon]|nr:MAG: hypothetical protein EU529_05760 [Candidatus Lokiarchaeota archaeon]